MMVHSMLKGVTYDELAEIELPPEGNKALQELEVDGDTAVVQLLKARAPQQPC
jgi:vacuolar-type H+-ATPase subunit B/Vma2